MVNIQEEIKKLQDIHNILMTRLYNIEHFTNSYRNSDIVIKQFEEREYIQLGRSVSWADTENLYFGYLSLKTGLVESFLHWPAINLEILSRKSILIKFVNHLTFPLT